MRFGSGGEQFAEQRTRMVEHQLRRRGIEDERVLEAMAAVPRELFVPERHRRRAYADSALPISEGQTISQPWIVAAICQALDLRGSERVLEIGTGSGYSAVVLSRLAAEVITVERVEELARGARELIDAIGIANVEVVVGDGSEGLPEQAPFDSIAVHATGPAAPQRLIEELVIGGRLVIPIAADTADLLTVFRRIGERVDPSTGEGLEREVIGPCRFVPLIGSQGFPE